MLLIQIITRTELLILALETCISIHSITPEHEFKSPKDEISEKLQFALVRVTEVHDFARAMKSAGQTETSQPYVGTQQKLMSYLETLPKLEEEVNDLIEHQRSELVAFKLCR